MGGVAVFFPLLGMVSTVDSLAYLYCADVDRQLVFSEFTPDSIPATLLYLLWPLLPPPFRSRPAKV